MQVSYNGQQQVLEVDGARSPLEAVQQALQLPIELSSTAIYSSPLLTFLDDEQEQEQDPRLSAASAPAVTSLSQMRDSLWTPDLADPSISAYLDSHRQLGADIYFWKFQNACRTFFNGLQAYERTAFLGIRAVEVSTLSFVVALTDACLQSALTITRRAEKSSSATAKMDAALFKQIAVEVSRSPASLICLITTVIAANCGTGAAHTCSGNVQAEWPRGGCGGQRDRPAARSDHGPAAEAHQQFLFLLSRSVR